MAQPMTAISSGHRRFDLVLIAKRVETTLSLLPGQFIQRKLTDFAGFAGKKNAPVLAVYDVKRSGADSKI